ncbi:phosphoglycerate mutase family member 5 [Nesidiocoris tenuis]|uniref:Phosphoglycerate mutase family member 5 n=1 Tax=Nesidiocoris tenuis TaxID=355587 RepID=A0ABN7AYY6_9HEMI|nr:phosphoglycerate mutase family member 5 [Nesidiocoris tenuis]
MQTRISAWDIDWDQREPCGEVDLGYCADRHIILVCEGQNSVDKKAGPEKKLTPLGQEQMTRVANRLAELNLSYCYIMSSTSIAGQESLAIISKEIDAKKSGVNESLKDGHPVVPEPSRLLTPIPDHEFHQNVMKMEYAYRATFHRPDAKMSEDSYEVLICPSNVIKYFICRALQLPAAGWARFAIPQGSITWIIIDKMGNVAAESVGETGHLDFKKITF